MNNKHVKIIIKFFLMLIFVLFFGGILKLLLYSNKIILKNSSNDKIFDIRLNLQSLNGKWSENLSIDVLDHGDKFVFRHNQNDLRVKFNYVIKDKIYFEEKYIDLWSGEGYMFEIQTDGSIISGHSTPHTIFEYLF